MLLILLPRKLLGLSGIVFGVWWILTNTPSPADALESDVAVVVQAWKTPVDCVLLIYSV